MLAGYLVQGKSLTEADRVTSDKLPSADKKRGDALMDLTSDISKMLALTYNASGLNYLYS